MKTVHIGLRERQTEIDNLSKLLRSRAAPYRPPLEQPSCAPQHQEGA